VDLHQLLLAGLPAHQQFLPLPGEGKPH
jgi:hypothetical protein